MKKLLFIMFIGLTNLMFSQDFPILKGEYFGLTPPGLTPEVFAPNIVSDSTWAEHCQVAVSPKGDEIYWSAWTADYKTEDGSKNTEQLFHSKIKNGKWTKPEVANFVKNNKHGLNGGPVFSPDGNRLYFYQVKSPWVTSDMNTYYVKKQNGKWSTEPMNVGQPYNSKDRNYSPVFTQKGNAYKSSKGIVSKYTYENEKFMLVDTLIIHKDFIPKWNIYVSPEEDYVIFAAKHEGGYGDIDLYLSFKSQDDKWGYPINMGPKINTKLRERFPTVSPDGKYMFFMRHTPGQDFFWVSTDIIEKLRKQSKGMIEVKESIGVEMQQIDDSLSYDELQSKVIDFYRKDSLDTAILYMEYAHNKYPEYEIQSLKVLGQIYTKAGLYSKAIAVWKDGIDKGYQYNLNKDSYQKYYKDNIEFEKLAKIEKDKMAASHIKHEVLLPDNYDAKKVYPVLFIFHGNNRNIELSRSIWTSETMKEKYITVFVQSYFNMTNTTYQWLLKDDKTDKEFKEIYDSILKTYSIDTNNIIFAGMSAGGMKVVDYAFKEFIPMTGLVLNCPVIPTDIKEEDVNQFVEKNKKIGIITGGKDFALVGQKKLLSDIENLNGKTKMLVNKDLGHNFAEDFSIKLDEYLKWVIE